MGVATFIAALLHVSFLRLENRARCGFCEALGWDFGVVAGEREGRRGEKGLRDATSRAFLSGLGAAASIP